MTDLLVAILLAVVSAVCYASAAIVQERIAATTPPSRYALLHDSRWWAAVLLNGLGALLHVVALGFGPLAVVQPLGVLTIVFVSPLAALFAGRPVSPAGWRGIALVSTGLMAVLLVSGAHASRRLQITEQYALAGVAVLTVTVLILVVTFTARVSGRAGLRSPLLATAAGIAYGTASVCVKTVAEGWALTSLRTAVPVLVLTALFAAIGLATSQASYRGGGLAAPLATATAVNPVVAATVGVLLLQEGFRFGTAGVAAAAVGTLVAVRGLVILAQDATQGIRATKAVILGATGARAPLPGGHDRSSPVMGSGGATTGRVPARRRRGTTRSGAPSEGAPRGGHCRR